MPEQRRSVARPLNWGRFDIAPVWLTLAPTILLVAAALVSVLTGVTSTAASIWLMVALSVVAIVLQCSWIRAQAIRAPIRVFVFLVQFAVTAALIGVSPYFGIYAFMGYLSALMLFSGAPLWIALCSNAVLPAVAQIGGYGQVAQGWPTLLVLIAVNSGLVFLFSWVGDRRDSEIAAREAAVRELEAAHQRNSELQEKLLSRARERGVLEERARLSREIHDTVAQDLVAIVSQLEAIDDMTPWRPRVETSKRLARSGLAEARRAISALRSPVLDDQPLPVAITELVSAWGTVHLCRTNVVIEGDAVSTDSDQHLVRICQEALSNVSRHAGAECVDVRLTYAEEGVILDIADDGAGFDPGEVVEGNGLRGIRERVEASGGTVEVSGTAGQGCSISAVVPA